MATTVQRPPTASADRNTPEPPPPGAADPSSARGGELGLSSSTALVVGSIIGTGVFTMPAVMAGAGTSSIVTLGVIAVGAILLGQLFGQLTKRVPNVDGGLYAYSAHEFGDFAGFLTAWCYWITCWAGNAAIVSSWVLYVESLFGIENPSAWTNLGIALAGLWIPAIVNLAGVKQMSWLQNVTVVLKFVPLLFVGIVGWFFVSADNFGPFNASGGSLYDGIGIAAGVALFSFIGVECASIAAGRVKNPRRNVGRASVFGTAASGLLYIAVTAVIMGLVPHDQLVNDGAPFVAGFKAMFDGAGWAGKVVALIAVVSGLGALNGWTLVTAEMPFAAARDGMFPRAFAKEDAKGTPWFGIIISTIVASVLMAWSYSGATGLKVFTYLVYLSVVTVAIPYFFSACAQLAYLVSRRRKVQGWRLARDIAISVASMLFALWVTMASGYQSVYQTMLLVLIGLPIYAFLKARRERDGLTPEPVDQDDAAPEGTGGTPLDLTTVSALVVEAAELMAPRALVRRPGPRLVDGIVTHLERVPVDLDLATRQWEAYTDVLASSGWDLITVPPADDCPDAVFIEDAVVVFHLVDSFRDIAVITRPGADARKPETIGLRAIIEVEPYAAVEIEAPGTLDGGDVLKVGNVVYVGCGGRTNGEGIRQLRAILSPHGISVVAVPVTKVLHLKSAVTALPDGTVIGYEPLVDDTRVFERFLPVPEESGSHVVDLGAGRLLMAADAPRSAALFESLGYETVRVDIGEFQKLEGCVTCLSVRLRRP